MAAVPKWVYLVLGILTLGIPALFVYHWDLYHTSDYSMIGLMAKRLIEHGEQNIFVWRAGYMGVLLETNLVALMFRLFGMDPFTLNFAPYLIFLALIPVFFVYVKRTSSSWVAVVSTGLLLISTPYFYGKVIRTQPNYTLIYLLGFLLFIFYDRLQGLFFAKRFAYAKFYRLIALSGLTAGFAVYTYRQVFYFFIAIGLHLGLYYLRFLGRQWSLTPRQLFRAIFDISFLIQPKRRRLVFLTLAILNLAHFLTGLTAWITDTQGVWIGEHELRFGALSMMLFSVYAWIGLHIAFHFSGLRRWARDHRRALTNASGIFVGSFVIGFSPELYYNYVLKGGRWVQTSGVQAHFENTLRNLDYAQGGIRHFLNLDQGHPWEWPLLIAAIGLMVWTLWRYSHVFLQSLREPQNRVREIPVILCLGPAALAVYVMTKFIYDHTSIRYLLVILFFMVYCLGFALVQLWRQEQGFKRWSLAGVAFLLLTNNAYAFFSKIRKSDHGADWKHLVAILRANNIKYGYAQYWFAYYTNFLTREEIILEPVNSNFSPHYEPIVRVHPRLAYVDTHRQLHPLKGNEIEIRGRKYRLEKQIDFRPKNMSIHQGPVVEKDVKEHGIYVYILNKI